MKYVLCAMLAYIAFAHDANGTSIASRFHQTGIHFGELVTIRLPLN